MSYFQDRDGLLVVDKDGKFLLERNADIRMVPASTLKILTALVALEAMGKEYCFKTEAYLTKDGDLRIKGYGDPMFISEMMPGFVFMIKQKVLSFKKLLLDNTYFAADIDINGRNSSLRPYDAPPGALCSNYNTVAVSKNADGSLKSGETQTPLVSMAKKASKKTGITNGRFIITHSSDNAARYTGELLLFFMKQEGIKNENIIELSPVAEDDELILVFESPYTLDYIVQNMLEYSNNFIANQLLLAMGAHFYGPEGTVEKGADVIKKFLSGNCGIESPQIAEGSGLSRENLLSPREMLKILNYFEPYRELLVYKEPVWFKSGSLSGVKARAGYIETSEGDFAPFVIMCGRDFIDIDKAMLCLGKHFSSIVRN